MNAIESEKAKLLLFASKLPGFEKSILKDLVVQEDAEVLAALRSFVVHGDGEAFQVRVLTRVVESAVDRAHATFQKLFASHSTDSGKILANGGRERIQDDVTQMSSLVYGEIDFFAFAMILHKVKPQAGEVFYDLGHGLGKAVIAAALLSGHLLSRCSGLELLPELHGVAEDVAQLYAQLSPEERVAAGWAEQQKDQQPTGLTAGEVENVRTGGGPVVDMREGDLTTQLDWVSADIVFANSTCFSPDLMSQMARLAEGMRPGARFVTLTKPLPSGAFTMVERKDLEMSWGAATCFLHVRNNDDNSDDDDGA